MSTGRGSRSAWDRSAWGTDLLPIHYIHNRRNLARRRSERGEDGRGKEAKQKDNEREEQRVPEEFGWRSFGRTRPVGLHGLAPEFSTPFSALNLSMA